MSFIVADEAAVSGQPSDAALDHLAAQDCLKSWGDVGAADDLADEVEKSGFVEQLAAVVGGIGEEVLHSRPAPADGVEDQHCSSAPFLGGRVAGISFRLPFNGRHMAACRSVSH